jgi:hypothetical protein
MRDVLATYIWGSYSKVMYSLKKGSGDRSGLPVEIRLGSGPCLG